MNRARIPTRTLTWQMESRMEVNPRFTFHTSCYAYPDQCHGENSTLEIHIVSASSTSKNSFRYLSLPSECLPKAFLHSPHHGQPSRCCHLSGCHSQCACAEQEKDVGGEEVIWALGCELHGSGSSRFDPVRRLWHPWFVHGRRGTSLETQ